MDGYIHHETDGPLLSPEDIAQRCGLSRRAVYDAIRRGEIRAMKLCGRLRIRREDLDAWMTAAAISPPPPPPSRTELRRRRLEAAPAGSFKRLMAEGGGGREAA